MKKTIKDMNSIIKEIKDFQSMQEQLKAEIEELKAQAIEIMTDEQIDEFTCDEGKVTYREVLSNRFDSTAFKKSEWAELYKEYSKQTSSMRFTCN